MTNSVTMTFTWDQLMRELDRLAVGDTQQAMVPYLVSSLQKQQPFMNSELLLHEIVSTVACVSDQTFPLDLAEALSGSAPSPDSRSSL